MKLIEKLDDQTREDIRTISDILSQSSYQCYMVGGCVRDLLLGRPVKDIDITTNAEPQVVQKLFKRTVPTGIQHGTITVLFEKRSYEITTYRAEGTYSDARRPDTITFAKTLSEDLSRRDFTINALAYDPTADVLQDEHGGLDDLKQKIIRTIGKAHDRFFEDGLRTVRACRFASVLDFRIEEETFKAICDPAIHERTKKVAVERFSDELRKGLSGPFPSRLIELLEDTGLMNLFLPYKAPRPELQKLSLLSNVENRLGCYLHFICMREKDPVASIESTAKKLKLSNETAAQAIRTHRFLLASAGDLNDVE
ncbi:MAG TPA: poly-A polymerase, partial [Leptospiraceae bacterium]|nr:poly-A polymerase [Leptospiraceae bacterium]